MKSSAHKIVVNLLEQGFKAVAMSVPFGFSEGTSIKFKGNMHRGGSEPAYVFYSRYLGKWADSSDGGWKAGTPYLIYSHRLEIDFPYLADRLGCGR